MDVCMHKQVDTRQAREEDLDPSRRLPPRVTPPYLPFEPTVFAPSRGGPAQSDFPPTSGHVLEFDNGVYAVRCRRAPPANTPRVPANTPRVPANGVYMPADGVYAVKCRRASPPLEAPIAISIYLSIYLSICLSIYLSIYLSISLSIYEEICIYIDIDMCVSVAAA